MKPTEENEASERTKYELAAALLNALEKKPLEKITIKELTDACRIKRQSFYYHFNDIYGLLEWVLERDRSQFARAQDQYLRWQEYALELFRTMEKNRKKYVSISDTLGWRYIARFYQKDLRALLYQTIQSYAESSGTAVNPRHVDFLVDYYSLALSAILESWIHGNLAYSPEELVENFDTAIQNEAWGAALRRSCRPPASGAEGKPERGSR